MHGTPTRGTTRVVALTLGIALSAFATNARADNVLVRGTRPGWASFALGPTIFIPTNNGDQGATWLHLNEQVGWHFLGQSDGPALALDVHQLLGNYSILGHFTLRLDARFLYDIALSPSLPLYLTPSVALGWHWTNLSGSIWGFSGSQSWNGLDLNAAVELRLVLANRGLLFMRPLGFSFPVMFPPNAGQPSRVWFSYELLFGGGVTF